MLPARVPTRGAEANKSFLRYVSNTYALWVTAVKREAEKGEMERCGEAMETGTAALPDPSGMAWMEAKWTTGPWLAPQPCRQQSWVMPTAFLGASRKDGGDTNHTCSHFFNSKYPNDSMDNRTCLSHWGWGRSRYERVVNAACTQNDGWPQNFLVMS